MPKVVRLHSVGAPDVLSLEEIDVPAPGAGEVRITVKAIGLNRTELGFRSGGHGLPIFPSKIGYEAAGIIESVGYGVTNFAIGDRVTTIPGLSMQQYGTYGELILYRADMLIRTPEYQTDVEAAATWMQYLTAYGALAYYKLADGDPVVITAASSSVGIAAIQLVNAAGGIPIAVTRTRNKVSELLKLGAKHVVVSDEEDVPQAVRKLTNGMGAAVLFDAVVGSGFPSLLGALRYQGLAVIYGALGGDAGTVPVRTMTSLNLAVRGYAANHLLAAPDMRTKAFEEIETGLLTGKLKPAIDRLFDLSEIIEAHRYMELNKHTGKLVITVNH